MVKKFYIYIISILTSFTAFANNVCVLPDGLNAHTSNNTLDICENGKIINEYKISIGRNGVGKTSSGDNKTPLGLYDLGTPRKSTKFEIFIPIQYPTKQQIAAGYTGKDVGIHGPFWLFGWAGSLNTSFNWTKGCIAVAENSKIKSTAKWVEDHPHTKILIQAD